MLNPPALLDAFFGCCLRHHGTALRAGKAAKMCERDASGLEASQVGAEELADRGDREILAGRKGGLVVRDARHCRAPHHDGPRPHPESLIQKAANEIGHSSATRYARPCAGHPRPTCAKQERRGWGGRSRLWRKTEYFDAGGMR